MESAFNGYGLSCFNDEDCFSSSKRSSALKVRVGGSDAKTHLLLKEAVVSSTITWTIEFVHVVRPRSLQVGLKCASIEDSFINDVTHDKIVYCGNGTISIAGTEKCKDAPIFETGDSVSFVYNTHKAELIVLHNGDAVTKFSSIRASLLPFAQQSNHQVKLEVATPQHLQGEAVTPRKERLSDDTRDWLAAPTEVAGCEFHIAAFFSEDADFADGSYLLKEITHDFTSRMMKAQEAQASGACSDSPIHSCQDRHPCGLPHMQGSFSTVQSEHSTSSISCVASFMRSTPSFDAPVPPPAPLSRRPAESPPQHSQVCKRKSNWWRGVVLCGQFRSLSVNH